MTVDEDRVAVGVDEVHVAGDLAGEKRFGGARILDEAFIGRLPFRARAGTRVECSIVDRSADHPMLSTSISRSRFSTRCSRAAALVKLEKVRVLRYDVGPRT